MSSESTPARPKLSIAEVRARAALSVDRPANAATDLAPGDEYDDSYIVLDVIDQMEVYDKNPRSKQNPKYYSLKESIRVQGVTNQITVTKRPGSKKYFPHGGGNTRVQILQELWQETQDPKYRRLNVRYRKWRGDAVNIAAHLAENNERGETSFWDNATGIANLKMEIEREDTSRVLTATEVNKEAKRLGVDFGLSAIQNFLFAVEYLKPVGPWLTLRAVNGHLRPAILALDGLCQHLGVAPRDFRAAITAALEMSGDLLRAQEGNNGEAQIDLDDLVRSLHDAVAGLLSVPAAQIPLMLAARASAPRMSVGELRAIAANGSSAAPLGSERGHSADTARPDASGPAETSAAPPAPAAQGGKTDNRSPGGSPAATPETSSRQLPLQPAMLAPVGSATATVGSAGSAERPARTAERDPGPLVDPTDPAHAPGTVQAILTDIMRLAELDDVLFVCDAMPLGYYVELPHTGIESVDGRPAKNPALRKAAWHVLATLSGQYHPATAAALPPDSAWRQAVEAGSHQLAEVLERAVLGHLHDGAPHLAVLDVSLFFWHPELAHLFLQLWSWALHWQRADPARFANTTQPLAA